MVSPPSIDALNDDALLNRFALAVRRNCEQARVLLELIDVIDRRKLWAKQGHSSLFSFCVDRFHMSESTAAKRIGAARCARRFPTLLDMVARGELHLSGIHRLKAYLTDANHRRVLARAKHQTLKQIEVLVRGLSPQPDVPSRVRKLPDRQVGLLPSRVGAAPARAAQPTMAPQPTEVRPAGTPPQVTGRTVQEPERMPRAPDPAPLSPGRYRLQVTLKEEAHGTLRQLQDLLAHQVPNGDPAVIVERALRVLLTETLKKKAALTARPRTPKRRESTVCKSTRCRAVPAGVKREVWKREQGSCGFVGADGRRCGETRGLEFAHKQPWGKGGDHTSGNLSLRCKAHNALEAERDYGEAFMRMKRERGRSPSETKAKSFRVSEPEATYGRSRTHGWRVRSPGEPTGVAVRPPRSLRGAQKLESEASVSHAQSHTAGSRSLSSPSHAVKQSGMMPQSPWAPQRIS